MKRIVIIGAGIAGLSTYHALRKYLPPQIYPSLQIVIYESHSSPSATTSLIGGGLGLAPNGFRALNAISPEAVKFIEERGFECEEFVMRNQKGRKLGSMRHWEGGTVEENGKQGFGMVMIARGDVHRSLLRESDGENVEDVVQWGRKVKEVREEEDRVEVVFEDGEVDVCDLVIGADGAWSKCRDAIFGEEYQPKYDGLTAVGGFLPLNSLSPRFQEGLKEEPVTMTFSRSGFFGYSMCTNASLPSEDQYLTWWSTYETKTPLSKDTPLQEVRTQLLNRHGMWKSPHDTSGSPQLDVFPQIINLAFSQAQTADKQLNERSKWLILPRFMTPRMPHWTSLHGNFVKGPNSPGYGRIILVGDARNTMPPDSGQGVSCAAEDALTVALLLKHFLKPQIGVAETVKDDKQMDAETLKKLAKSYEDIRLPRVGKILDSAKRRGDGKRELGFIEEKVRNVALFVVSHLPTSMFASTYTYDVEKVVDDYLAKQEWRW